MLRSFLFAILALLTLPVVAADPPAKTGILVFDDCDKQYEGKAKYEDNLTFVDSTGEQVFRISGFNNCESIGSSRMIAVDSPRNSIWVVENVAHCIRRFDFSGKETLAIPVVHGSAIAVDPETGHLWAFSGDGHIGKGKTVVFNEKGKEVKSFDVPGWDITYDDKTKSLWIADDQLRKVDPAKSEFVFRCQVSTWCSSSLDIDPRDGAVWVAVREHSQVTGSSNRLFKFDAAGTGLRAVNLDAKSARRVSVDPKNGSVWAACGKSLERFSADGEVEATFPIDAISVQVDPAGTDVWVATPTELQKLTPRGAVTRRLKHAGTTTQAWMAAVK